MILSTYTFNFIKLGDSYCSFLEEYGVKRTD